VTLWYSANDLLIGNHILADHNFYMQHVIPEILGGTISKEEYVSICLNFNFVPVVINVH